MASLLSKTIASLILLHEVAHQLEHRNVTFETNGLVGIEDRMIILESIALFILQEDAGNMADGKRVMVAVGGQVATM